MPDACPARSRRSPRPAGSLSEKPQVTDHSHPMGGTASAPLCPCNSRGPASPCRHARHPGSPPPACPRSTTDTTRQTSQRRPGRHHPMGTVKPKARPREQEALADDLGWGRGAARCVRWHLAAPAFGGVLSCGLLPSTQAGRALVVPAICPFLQAQRAVCRAIVLRGWLLSRSRVTISQVPAAS